MPGISNINLNYDLPIKIAEGVYWIGFYDAEAGLHCNPYLIIDGNEAVVIDGGSRPDFPIVMMKIMQTGISPSFIKALVYQHYDPDLCGSIPNFEDIIDSRDLKIISDSENNMFIRHYSLTSRLISLEAVGHIFEFSSGRRLRFINTPYAHSAGSFMTFDDKSGILFTSDLFGSYSVGWNLFLTMNNECRTCSDYSKCRHGRDVCPLPAVVRFHQKIMPSERALKHAMEAVAKIPFTVIAPQHGSVITDVNSAEIICSILASLKGVGIDRVTGNRLYSELGVITPLKERLKGG